MGTVEAFKLCVDCQYAENDAKDAYSMTIYLAVVSVMVLQCTTAAQLA